MIAIRPFFGLALPAGLTVFCWLTMRTRAAYGDETGIFLGFPLAWYAPDAATSLGYAIAPLALLLDLLAYLAVAGWACRWLPSGFGAPKRHWVLLALWAAAVLSIGGKILVLGPDARFVGGLLDGYFGANAKRSYSLHVGLGH